MKRLDFEGLHYYTSKLIGKIKSWFVGTTPTVLVRPSDELRPVRLEDLDVKIGKNRVGTDVQSDIQAKIYSDSLLFIIRCDSEESARKIIQSGEYLFRFSYLSKRYNTPKWVCPSRNRNSKRWVAGTAWEQIPLTEDTCTIHGPSILINTGWGARDLMLEIVDHYYITEQSLRDLMDSIPSESIYPFLLENALIFGSNTWNIWAPKIIRKSILFKGITEYLDEIGQNVTSDTIRTTPSNSYGFPIKASVWKGDLELPGQSIGTVSFHKRDTLLGVGGVRFFYKYKETKRY